jgi:hypothetical protein
MKRSAVAVLLVLVAALLVAGCGGGSSSSSSSTAPSGGAKEGGTPKATSPNAPAGSKVVSCGEDRMEIHELRATAVDCATARTTTGHWVSSHACALGDGSRSSCSLGGLRCQAVRVGKGASVSCAGPQGDVSFIATAWLAKKPAG